MRLALALCLPGGILAAAEEVKQDAGPGAAPCVIVVTGAPGTAEYGAEHAQAAARWDEAARAGGAELVRIGPRPEDAPASAPPAKSDRELLEEAVRARAAQAGDRLWVVYLGHGTFDGKLAKINLRGPDVAAAELAAWLAGAKRPLAILICAASSGPFINALSGPDRVVVTATKSGHEIHYARFGLHLAEAIGAAASDLDKDEQVSILEAFLAASARTAEFYRREARLATEHALIDDNGDGLGTPADWFHGIRAVRRAQSGAPPDGPRAARAVLVRKAAERELPPALRERRDALELEVERLREQKAALGEEAYYVRLEEILLELARLHEELEGAGARR
jgi:hypothetical protein